jgi:stage II sporulation protein M
MSHENRAILSEAKWFIYFAIFLFLAGAVVGYSWPTRFEVLLASLHGMAEQLRGKSAPMLIIAIFIQNGFSALLAVWLGIILGIVPMIGAITNGILLGVVLAVFGNGLGIVTGLLPHGIFELPAIFIAWGLGMWRGMWLISPNRKEIYKDRARKSYYVFFRIVLPLLAIAAIIEGLAIAALA